MYAHEQRRALARWGLALLLSVAVHVALIYGVRISPASSTTTEVLTARIIGPEAQNGSQSQTPASRALRAARVTAKEAWQPAVQSQPERHPVRRGTRAQVSTSIGDETALPHAVLPVLTDPVWYEAKDLDVYPQALTVDSASMQTDGVGGTVTLLVAVDENGSVHEVTVLEAEPAGYFEARALGIFQQARFSPAQREGRPVRSKIVVKVPFTLTAGAAAADSQ
jgi:protein TonB